MPPAAVRFHPAAAQEAGAQRDCPLRARCLTHPERTQQLMRTVLELDLTAYAEVARVLEENLDV
jgi:hypothetical protein